MARPEGGACGSFWAAPHSLSAPLQSLTASDGRPRRRYTSARLASAATLPASMPRQRVYAAAAPRRSFAANFLLPSNRSSSARAATDLPAAAAGAGGAGAGTAAGVGVGAGAGAGVAVRLTASGGGGRSSSLSLSLSSPLSAWMATRVPDLRGGT